MSRTSVNTFLGYFSLSPERFQSILDDPIAAVNGFPDLEDNERLQILECIKPFIGLNHSLEILSLISSCVIGHLGAEDFEDMNL